MSCKKVYLHFQNRVRKELSVFILQSVNVQNLGNVDCSLTYSIVCLLSKVNIYNRYKYMYDVYVQTFLPSIYLFAYLFLKSILKHLNVLRKKIIKKNNNNIKTLENGLSL